MKPMPFKTYLREGSIYQAVAYWINGDKRKFARVPPRMDHLDYARENSFKFDLSNKEYEQMKAEAELAELAGSETFWNASFKVVFNKNWVRIVLDEDKSGQPIRMEVHGNREAIRTAIPYMIREFGINPEAVEEIFVDTEYTDMEKTQRSKAISDPMEKRRFLKSGKI